MNNQRIAAAMGVGICLWVGGVTWAAPLGDRVPGDALVYVGWAGSTTPPSGFEGSRLEAVLSGSQVSEMWSRCLPSLVARVGRQDREVARVLERLAPLARAVWR